MGRPITRAATARSHLPDSRQTVDLVVIYPSFDLISPVTISYFFHDFQKWHSNTKAKVPEHMLDPWGSSDGQGRTELARDLFDQGMSTSETASVIHFTHMMALLLLATGEEFCKNFGQFGDDLKDVRESLGPKVAPQAE